MVNRRGKDDILKTNFPLQYAVQNFIIKTKRRLQLKILVVFTTKALPLPPVRP